MTAIIILVVVIVLVAVWFVTIYNGIVTADNKCDNAWQTIDAQLQRRCQIGLAKMLPVGQP